MQQALKLALALTQARDEAALCNWLLDTIQSIWQPQGILLGIVDVSGRRLLCEGCVQNEPVSMRLAVDDFTHPLAYVLHKNQSFTWGSLYEGARVEHSEFQQLLCRIGSSCGLRALPLKSESGRTLAILALLDNAERLQVFHQNGEDEYLGAAFCRQLVLLRALLTSHRESEALKYSINQFQDENQRETYLTQLIENNIIGRSSAIKMLRLQIYQASRHQLVALIQGETGVGKDVVARQLHQCSERADMPFIAINCAAIPENLIESELFGYEKGAFSGAQSNKVGLVAQASGGTLFLDEVGDMPQVMQAKLLRVLETHKFRPLGAGKEHHSDFRLIAATHQPLQQRVIEGTFRQDLYHRLCQCLLQVPPLRERLDDIAPLCEHFISQFSHQQKKQFGSMEPAFLQLLVRYDFPGNVRELRNLLELVCTHTPEGEGVMLAALSQEMRERMTSSTANTPNNFHEVSDLRIAIQQFETAVIKARLHQFHGDRFLAAESLNMPKRTFNHKCQKLEMN